MPAGTTEDASLVEHSPHLLVFLASGSLPVLNAQLNKILRVTAVSRVTFTVLAKQCLRGDLLFIFVVDIAEPCASGYRGCLARLDFVCILIDKLARQEVVTVFEYSTKTCLDNLVLIHANSSNHTNLSELSIIYLN